MSDAQDWAAVCREHDDLRRGARRYGLGDVYDALVDEVGTDAARLAGWLDLRRRVLEYRRHEMRYGKHPPDGDVDAHLRAYGISDWSPVTYVCPVQRCSRTEPAIGRTVPTCDLFDRPMSLHRD
jgi:hypothetical protein